MLYFLILNFFFVSITEIIIFGMVSPNIIFLMLKYCYTNMMVTTSYNYKKKLIIYQNNEKDKAVWLWLINTFFSLVDFSRISKNAHFIKSDLFSWYEASNSYCFNVILSWVHRSIVYNVCSSFFSLL